MVEIDSQISDLHTHKAIKQSEETRSAAVADIHSAYAVFGDEKLACNAGLLLHSASALEFSGQVKYCVKSPLLTEMRSWAMESTYSLVADASLVARVLSRSRSE